MSFNVLDRETRKKRIELLSERTNLYEKLRQKRGLDSSESETYLADLKELAKLKRIDRSEDDVLFFMYEYFSEERNPENDQNLIPAGVSMDDAPKFHRELCEILNVVSNEELNKRVAWACPRGHAKSAYLSNCFPVHQIVFNKRKFILIISETETASRKFLEFISLSLKFNEKLRVDFGELLSPKKAMNERDNTEQFLTKNGILVQSASMGKQLRGARNGQYRPDLVILDDLESSKNTNTPELREKNLDWLNKVIIPIGQKNTAFIYLGTIVHASGLLPAVLQRPDFESRIYSAIVSPPEREDLWQQFEEIYRNAENENRKEDALAFYYENEEEMNRGVETLWSWRWSYLELMMEKANIGSRAFGSEFLNNPIDEESQIFKPSMFTFFDYEDLHKLKNRLDYFSAWDIAMGKNSRSDYNAIVTIARDRKTGIIYVVDAWAKKCPAHEALEMAVKKIREHRLKIFAVETVQAQHDLFRQLRERLPREGIYFTKLKPIVSKGKKEERIESLEPLVENGILRFMRHQRLLLEQMEQFPNADHDDCIDACQMAVELCGAGRRRTFHRKPAGL